MSTVYVRIVKADVYPFAYLFVYIYSYIFIYVNIYTMYNTVYRCINLYIAMLLTHMYMYFNISAQALSNVCQHAVV